MPRAADKDVSVAPARSTSGSAREVFVAFLKLGLTSFGGPIAHLGYFRTEFVERRGWLTELAYADLVALCQFLPGPASSQVAVSIGVLRAGLTGGVLSWLGFSMPSALVMVAFGYGVDALGDLRHAAWAHGLKIVAVAVVAQAIQAMARNLCPDPTRATVAVGSALLALAMPSTLGQVGAIAIGAVIGRCFLASAPDASPSAPLFPIKRGLALGSLATFALLLMVLQITARSGNHLIQLLNAFYRSGALVFGGGHVVLPLLHQAVVVPGWIDNDAFLAGYGAAQAVPGPLFTFAAYLGTAMRPSPHGLVGGLACLVAIYLPSFLLLLGVLPFWDRLRAGKDVQAALRGVSAAVVGLLIAAWYDPVWTNAICGGRDFGLALAAFLALTIWNTPPWLVVLAGAGLASLLATP